MLSAWSHRDAVQIRFEYPTANKWISFVKRGFVKAPSRVCAFKEENPGVPLLPEPCLIHWGTWLEACLYFEQYFHVYQFFIPGLDPDDAEAIEVCIYTVYNINIL